jgi:cold shock CspA family protein
MTRVTQVTPKLVLSAAPEAVEHGRIKHYNAEREFGFISTDAGDELFFHRSYVIDHQVVLTPGMRVAFVRAPGKQDRQRATEIRVLSRP